MLKNRFQNFFSILKETFQKWIAKDPFKDSAVIAYYTIFSLPGLLVIVITVAGYFYDKQEITGEITTQIGRVMGEDTGKDIEAIFKKASETKGSVVASIIGIATLLFGATGVFYHVQQMLNKIWNVKPKEKTRNKIVELLRDRLFSFGLILVVGFLLLVSLSISAILSAVSGWVTSHLSSSLNIIFKLIDIIFSLALITILFAAIFKYLPDVKIKWRDVWGGAILTAVLFVLAQFGLGIYFGKSDPASSYGAAGSIILIMLWVTYAGLILLFGSEFTHVSICRKGEKPEPTSIAESVDEKEK